MPWAIWSKPRPLAIGPVLAEARDRTVDDALVDRAKGLVVDPEAKLNVRPIVLDHDIGGFHHPFEDRDAVRLLSG